MQNSTKLKQLQIKISKYKWVQIAHTSSNKIKYNIKVYKLYTNCDMQFKS